MKREYRLDLRLFDEGAGGAPSAEAVGAEGESQKGPESETSVTADTLEAKRTEFEKLIKGEYKELYDERAQKMIDARFKKTREFESRLKSLEPVMDILASKYGVEARDAEALLKAIEEDDGYYEEEAMEKGLTVEQLKHLKKIERENAEFKRAAEEQQRRQEASRVYSDWQRQSDELKAIYPSFELEKECQSPETGMRFVELLRNGIDVRTAYEVIHKDELLGGAMRYTAEAVRQKTVNDIRARGMRPAENGTSGNAASTVVKSDPRSFTKKDREEISRRVLRGERIEL